MASIPTADDVAAYRRGSLDLARFQAVDAWLATLDPAEQVRLLDGEPPIPLASEPLSAGDAFRSDGARTRFILGASLGRGGMGDVRLAHDQVLDRHVAIKLCRARAPEEEVASYAVRLRAFRREATITAQLEHPAIVPIHDVGVGPHGEPAYVMKRVEGLSLDAEVAARGDGSAADLAATVELAVRVAEAIAHAHQRGIVHRDLKPANVVAGALGVVSVLDWGLAARIGDTGERAGTPGWMAPEQRDGGPAAVTMDVYALGGLLLGLLTGKTPGPDLAAALADPRVPRGLAALMRSCLCPDPRQRPHDGAAVARELRHWLSAGVTAAEQPGALRRTIMLARHSPRASVGILAAVLVVSLGIAAAVLTQRQAQQQFRERLSELATTPLDDLPAVRSAWRSIGASTLPEAQALSARFQAAIEAAEARERADQQRAALRRLSARWREQGPWTDEAADLRTALARAGVDVTQVAASAHAVRASALHNDLLTILVQLQRTLLLDGQADPALTTIPAIIAGASDAPSWRGLADLLSRTRVEAHDLVLCECPGSEAALADPLTADLLLAAYGPEPRLVRHAAARLVDDPGAFWPRMVSARAAYDGHRDDEARGHALVALGREAHSLWPHVLLAYVAMRASDNTTLLAEAEAGLVANPEHLELRLLRAVALARNGKRDAAEALISDATFAAHLQYHRQHPHGHPMEDAVQALLATGVTLPDVPAELGPLVPGGHHH